MTRATHAARSDNDPDHQSGQILVLLSLALPILIAFIAMGVDLGQGYLQRRTNQNGADAGAVAGEQAITKGVTDAGVKSSISNVLIAGGYTAPSIVFLTPTSPKAGSDTTKVYVDAEYGSYQPGTATCTPLSSNQYVGSVGGGPPTAATCVHVRITTSDNSLFAKIPILGFAAVSASAQSSAGRISSAGVASAAAQPTPAPWEVDDAGEGYAVWGGLRADSTQLAVGSPVLFFADSGWNSGNDVQTNCSPCEYQATQNFKGLADSQCFTQPLPSICSGPNGAHGNAAAGLTAGTVVEVVIVSSVDHQGNSNVFTPIGLAAVDVSSSCPSTPSYLQSGTNGVCGTIQNIDYGALNERSEATPTPTTIIGNTN